MGISISAGGGIAWSAQYFGISTNAETHYDQAGILFDTDEETFTALPDGAIGLGGAVHWDESARQLIVDQAGVYLVNVDLGLNNNGAGELAAISTGYLGQCPQRDTTRLLPAEPTLLGYALMVPCAVGHAIWLRIEAPDPDVVVTFASIYVRKVG